MATIFDRTRDEREKALNPPQPASVPTTNYQSGGFGRPFTPEERARQAKALELMLRKDAADNK